VMFTVTVAGGVDPPPAGGVDGEVGEPPPPPQLTAARAPANTNAIVRDRSIDVVLQGTGIRWRARCLPVGIARFPRISRVRGEVWLRRP
jgi:hypothetical protein